MARTGNYLINIFEQIFLDNPNLTSLVLRSDSYVPQNRNSIISVAIYIFIQYHPNINSIIINFLTPGYSCNQETDSVHSCIEVLKKSEYYSPISLLWILLKVNCKKPTKLYN